MAKGALNTQLKSLLSGCYDPYRKVESQYDFRQRRIFVVLYVPLGEHSSQTIVNSKPSSEHISSNHIKRLTIGEGADSSRWDPSVDAPEAPCLVEALLTLQSGLNGVQGEEGQIHTHPCTASCLGMSCINLRSLCKTQSFNIHSLTAVSRRSIQI